MNQLILHIPHSSTKIPFSDGYVLDDASIKQEQLKLTDWFTDELFHSPTDLKIIAPFSRLFCDVERFENDEEETMVQHGMGLAYTKTDDGQELRKVTPDLRNRIVTEYYAPHHQRLNDAVQQQLNAYGKAFIIDCHSFPDVPFIYEGESPNRPDFNLGTDPFHTSPEAIDFAMRFFKKKGYSIKINSPYSGTIVPLDFYQKDQRVQSIMLEVNRKLYLKEGEKTEDYEKVQNLIFEFLKGLRKYNEAKR